MTITVWAALLLGGLVGGAFGWMLGHADAWDRDLERREQQRPSRWRK